MRVLQTALLGYGLAGRVFHSSLIRATPGFAIAAIVTSDPDRADQARRENPGVAIHRNVSEVWNNSHHYDLVVVATASADHSRHVLEAVDRGMHVVVEKPLAATVGEANQIVQAADQLGVHVIPFQNRRWDSNFLTLRREISSGTIGEVHRLEVRMESFRPLAPKAWRDAPYREAMRGVLFDLGSHMVDQAIQLLGPVQRVSAHIQTVRSADTAEDDVLLTLTHSDNSVSVLHMSKVAAIAGSRFLALGNRGAIRIDAEDSQERLLREGWLPSGSTWGLEPASSSAVVRVINEPFTDNCRLVPLSRGAWNSFYFRVRDAILGLKEPPVSLSDAVANIRVLEAAWSSSDSKESITLTPAASHVNHAITGPLAHGLRKGI